MAPSLSREKQICFLPPLGSTHTLIGLDYVQLALKIVFALSMDSTTNVFQRVPHKLINNVLPAILDISKPS